MMLTTSQAGEAIGLTRQAVWMNIKVGRLNASRRGVRGLAQIHVEDLRAFARTFDYTLDEEYLSRLAEPKEKAN